MVSFSPGADLASSVRRFVTEFYDLLGSGDVIGRLALASHEMLENAVRYSVDDEASLQIAYYAAKRRIRIETRNRSSAAHVASVRRLVEGMRSTSSRAEFYQSRIREAVVRTDGGSGLGLARIYAEAEMTVDFRREHDVLVIGAEATLAQMGGAS